MPASLPTPRTREGPPGWHLGPRDKQLISQTHRPGHPHDRLNHPAWACPLPAVLFCSQQRPVCVSVSNGQGLPQCRAGPSLCGYLSPMLISDVVGLYLLPPCISTSLPSPPSRCCYGNQALGCGTYSILDGQVSGAPVCVCLCVSVLSNVCVWPWGFMTEVRRSREGRR